MILILDDINRSAHADELDQAFRLRHRVLVDIMRWDGLRKADGREKDQFDGQGSVHFLSMQGDKLVGYHRLLPLAGPNLLRDVYPQLCRGTLPSGPGMFEWSRIVVEPDSRGRQEVGPTALELVQAMLAWLSPQGADSVVLETTPDRILTLTQLGFYVEPMGEIEDVDGVPSIALQAFFDQKTAMRIDGMLQREKNPGRAVA